MMKNTVLFGALLAVTCGPAFAQESPLLRGRALQDTVVGNTIYVHHPGCTEIEANLIIYFADDGKAFARERACRVAADRSQKLSGSWSMQRGEFCIRQMGEVQDHCITLVRVGDNTYKRIDRTGVRTDWSMTVLKEGNPEGF